MAVNRRPKGAVVLVIIERYRAKAVTGYSVSPVAWPVAGARLTVSDDAVTKSAEPLDLKLDYVAAGEPAAVVVLQDAAAADRA